MSNNNNVLMCVRCEVSMRPDEIRRVNTTAWGEVMSYVCINCESEDEANNLWRYDTPECAQCGESEYDATLHKYHGSLYCLYCIDNKMKWEYNPVMIKNKGLEKIVEECCICLNEKECEKGYFECVHALCSGCFNKLNCRICPLCRKNEQLNNIHPISELIMEFYKAYRQYPFAIHRYLNSRNAERKVLPFVYYAFDEINHRKGKFDNYDVDF